VIEKTNNSREIPTMKIQTVDSKGRLVLSGATPGEAYAVRQTGFGHYELQGGADPEKQTNSR
jgi:hypothetical protein